MKGQQGDNQERLVDSFNIFGRVSAGYLLRGAGNLILLLKNVYEWLLPRCSLCNSRLVRVLNLRRALLANHSGVGKKESDIERAKFICFSCYSARLYSICCKTSAAFHSKDDCSNSFKSGAMRAHMSPYHPSSHFEGPLSPEGLEAISGDYSKMLDLLASWAGGTRQEYLRGNTVLQTLGIIREDGRLSNPMEVEGALKLQAVQIGGNGFIKFFWEKNEEHHSERYVAGYGHKGNPYYKTRTSRETWFTGHAVCVLVEPTGGSKRNQRTDSNEPNRGSRSRSGNAKTELDYLRILGVTETVTKEVIRRAFRVSMSQYHPDRVAHLGEELRTLAEAKAKEINEAYAYFQRKYGY